MHVDDCARGPAGCAPTYTFLVYAAAVGSYFKGGQLTPIDLVVENRFHRAAPGGTGGTKAAGNYSPVSPPWSRSLCRPYTVMWL